MSYVAIILTSIWGSIYLLTRKNIHSGKVFFIFLLLMVLPSFFEPDFLERYIDYRIDYSNILILGGLMISGFIPWYYFDKHLKRSYIIKINHYYLSNLKYILIFLIVGSIISMIYLMPYAIKSMTMGAANIREYIREETILPNNYITTISVGFAALHIYCILFYFISYLDDALKRYRFWLFISSLSYIVNCMTITARDGFIVLPSFYIIFYIIFRNSLPSYNKNKIKRVLSLSIGLATFFITVFTASRFYDDKYRDNSTLAEGTIGYIAQQPYVFDSTVQAQDDFQGFEVRFPLINRMIGIGEHKVDRLDSWFETCFGTMYSDFYNIGGWSSVICVLLVFVCYYWGALAYCFRDNRHFAMLLIFTVYLYIVLTGVFYCKAGSSVSMNIFYIAISVLPLFMGNYITISQHAHNRNTHY